MARERKFSKPEWSWIMYDWANSVYATIIMAAIFPVYFAAIAPDGDVWWGYGTSIATLVVALLAPVLGAIADYKGMKKKLFTTFLCIGVVFTATMAIFGTWQLVLVGYIFSYIGFAGSNLFYDSFLTDVATPSRMDSVSATGYAMGYIGGSTIPFIIAIALTFLMDSMETAIKLSVVLTSVWWAVFSIFILKNVKQIHSLGDAPKTVIRDAFQNVGKTFTSIFKRRGLFLFIIAYFFYIDGVGTVIHMSTAYGSTLGLNTNGMIIALLVTQIVAVPCSIFFARLANKVGSIRMLISAVCVYFVICVVGFYMGYSLEGPQAKAERAYTDVFTEAAGGAEQDSWDASLKELYDTGLRNLNKDTRAEAFSEALDASSVDAATQAALRVKMPAVMSQLDDYDAALRRSNILFWCMAVLVGTCQGGIQALSRSYFGKLIPPEKSNEYFGFFDIFGKFAAVLGPFLYSTVRTSTGRASFGILSLMLLFLAGGLILAFGRKRIQAEERTDLESQES